MGHGHITPNPDEHTIISSYDWDNVEHPNRAKSIQWLDRDLTGFVANPLSAFDTDPMQHYRGPVTCNIDVLRKTPWTDPDHTAPNCPQGDCPNYVTVSDISIVDLAQGNLPRLIFFMDRPQAL